MDAWIVTDGELWMKTPETRRNEITLWLMMNGVDPNLVLADDTVMVAENDEGEWEIRYTELVLTETGKAQVDPDNPDEPLSRSRNVPLAIDPPQHWLTEVA